MHKIIKILLCTCFIVIDARITFPLKSDINDDLPPNKPETKINYRLPEYAEPQNYKIELTPKFEENYNKDFLFDGSVEITLNILKPVTEITLHSHNLTFSGENKNIEIQKAGVGFSDIKVEFKKETDFAILTSETEKTFNGTYTIIIKKFTGILNDNMRGFYRSSYNMSDTKKVWLATTHFEPVGARLAFPCFDEPQYKATFEITIIHDKKYTAISNMPKNDKDSTATKTVFKKTPKMSTYLVAFVVSDFKFKENKAKDFLVYARPNAIDQTVLALEQGELILKALDDYTKIEFKKNILKMQQAAIPDFTAGAMENWGLVLYREKSLLVDEKLTTTSAKQNVIETIAHEFAHQWFGDLVSPKWWKYLWLNEGFATFFQSYITQKVQPTWRSIEQSVVKSIQTTAMDFDSGKKSHPLNQDVESPAEISAIFDSISYQKGGAIIRMLQHVLTEKVFQAGLQNYLKKYANKNAMSTDLFEAIKEESKKANITLDITKIMDGWVNHKGYPVITVTRDYDKKTFEITQTPFFTYNETSNHTWHVPINYATKAKLNFDDTKPDDWLKDASKSIPAGIDRNDWLILNKQQTGYYRVNYDDENWQLIIDYLSSGNHGKIHVLNRAQLINDALAFAKQSQLSLKTLLHLTAYLKNETDYIAWYPAFKTFSWFNSKLINTEHYSFFKEYALKTMETLINKVGYEENEKDEYLTKFNRIAVINWACLFGNVKCRQAMQTKLEAWLKPNSKETIEPNLMQTTLCNGLRNENSILWNEAFNKLNKTLESKNDDEKNYLITALGCSVNRTVLENYLDKAIQDKSRLLKYAYSVIEGVLQNTEIGVDVALNFVVKKYLTIWRAIKDEDQIATLFTAIGEKITTSAQLEEFKKIKSTDIPAAIRDKSIEAAETNVKWVESNSNTLKDWKKEFEKSGVSLPSASIGLILSLLLITFFNKL